MDAGDRNAETQLLAALLALSEMVAEISDVDELLQAVVRIAPSLVHVDRCAILAYDSANRELSTLAAFGPGGGPSGFEDLRVSTAEMPRLSHRLLSLRLPTLVKVGSRELDLPAPVAQKLGVRSALLVPLACRGLALGCLWLDHTTGGHYFTSKEINLVQGIATQVALALEAAGRSDREALVEGRFRALTRALSDGSLRLDPELRVLEVDAGAEELLGWAASEIRGRRAFEVFDIADSDATAWRGPDGVPAPAGAILNLRARDGTAVPCEVVMVPVRGPDGVLAEVLYMLRRPEGTKVPVARAPSVQLEARPE